VIRAAIAALLFFLCQAHCTFAVYVSPDGLGQALVYPYYTVQSTGGNPFNTYVSIVNNDVEFGKALRVRFREGRHGREVAGFNLYLNPGDIWAGAVVPSAGGAGLVTVDLSCTSPGFPVDFAPGSVPTLAFSSASYTGANADGFGTDIERLREGYVEVLEMARFSSDSPNPADHCSDYRAERVSGAFGAPSGHIAGTLTLINVSDGMDFTVNADALGDLATDKYYRAPGDAYPDFNATQIGKVSAFVENGKLYRVSWPTGLEAVDAALMRASVANEVVLDTGTASATDWVMTFPTKRLHDGASPSAPFASVLVDGRDVVPAIEFAPRDGPGITREGDIRLRWAASVMAFRATDADPSPTTSDALGSRNAWSVSLPAGTQNGSAVVTFDTLAGSTGVSASATSVRVDDGTTATEALQIRGLPVAGFMVRTFRNGTLKCSGAVCQGNYGGSFPHKYLRELQ
jgi:hypothetical protein